MTITARPPAPKVVMEYRCPKCYGTNVEILLLTWEDMNTGESCGGSGEVAELYSNHYWCRDCADHIDEPTEVTVPQQPNWQEV